MNKRRLTNKAEATIEKIGPPTGIIQSLGPYITGDSFPFSNEHVMRPFWPIHASRLRHVVGTYLDEDDLLAADKVDKNGRAVSCVLCGTPFPLN